MQINSTNLRIKLFKYFSKQYLLHKLPASSKDVVYTQYILAHTIYIYNRMNLNIDILQAHLLSEHFVSIFLSTLNGVLILLFLCVSAPFFISYIQMYRREYAI